MQPRSVQWPNQSPSQQASKLLLGKRLQLYWGPWDRSLRARQLTLVQPDFELLKQQQPPQVAEDVGWLAWPTTRNLLVPPGQAASL